MFNIVRSIVWDNTLTPFEKLAMIQKLILSNSVEGETKMDDYHDNDGFFPSDHFPVYADLIITREHRFDKV